MSMVTYPLNNIEYTAEDAELFHSTRTSGVYATDSFDYSVTGADNSIVIGTGIAWIKNRQFSGKVVAQKEPMSLDMGLPDPTYPRIDAVVIQFNSNKNATEIVVKNGAASSFPIAPEVVRTESLYELHLYHVRREAGSLSISAPNITDLRNNNAYCGLMSDSITQAVDSTLSKNGVAADAAAVGNALAKKAPAGFGLGSVATYVDDFNNAAACGWYYGINAANSPLGDLVLLEVFSHVVTSWVVQKAYYMNANNEWHTMCVRYNKNGAWTEWEWINPPMMFGVEYRTTERRNGAPVYARAIDGGVSVAGDNTTVVSDIVGATIIRCDTTVGQMSGDFIANGDAANDWTVHTRYEGVHIYTWCGGSRTGLSIQHRIWYTK